eukprot:m.225556 g.225556  ORF g.225556 m.225556 type:complete len:145 (-) comp10835_c2_seq13:627-1061(-)
MRSLSKIQCQQKESSHIRPNQTDRVACAAATVSFSSCASRHLLRSSSLRASSSDCRRHQLLLCLAQLQPDCPQLVLTRCSLACLLPLKGLITCLHITQLAPAYKRKSENGRQPMGNEKRTGDLRCAPEACGAASRARHRPRACL